jgi:Protein of unknown function (DUF2752)
MSMSLQQRAHFSAGVVVSLCAVVFSFAPAKYHFYPICPFYAATHMLCPGCGGTRALHELLHFHLSAALQLNALVTLCAPIGLLWFCAWYYSVLRGGRGPRLVVPRFAIPCAYALTILFTVLRNTTPLFRF